MSDVQQPPIPEEERQIKEIENKVNDTLEKVFIPIGDRYFTISVNLNPAYSAGGKSTRRRQKK